MIAHCDAERAIDRRPDAVANRQDFVAVPLARLDRFGGSVVPVQLPAPVLVVELSPNPGADVCLVSMRLTVSVRLLRAELDSRVTIVRRQLHFDDEMEIFHWHRRPEELVLRHPFVRVPDDRPVLHGPEPLIAGPASQILAVEKGSFGEGLLALGIRRTSESYK